MLKLPIYMDNNATTPLDPRVLDAMMPYLTTEFGNAASRSHAFGWKAEEAVQKAREQVRNAITDKTILVSIMWANNEIGTVQPIPEIGAVVKERGILFHSDAVQGIGKLPFDVEQMRVDLVSISAHKFYGPKGIGALWVRRKPRVRIAPIIDGGGHERGMRSGTLNVPAIVGFGAAAEIAQREMAEEGLRTRKLRRRLQDYLF